MKTCRNGICMYHRYTPCMSTACWCRRLSW
jgi:hypothetical protein